MILISNEVIEVLNPSSIYLVNRTYLLQFILCAFGNWKGLFIELFNYLFTCYFCFIYLFYLFCWNNLPIILKKLNETYSEEMTNVFSKEAK